MSSKTSCASWLLLACLLLCFPAVAHRLGHDHDGAAAAAIASMNVADSLRAYSNSGDDALLRHASSVLDRQPPPHGVETWLQRAWLAQAEHRFEDALGLLQRVLRSQPNNGQAWLMQAAVAMVTGDREAARIACVRVAVMVSASASITCHARLARGREAQASAYAHLRQLRAAQHDPALQAWALSTEAELALSLGHVDAAERRFRDSLGVSPALSTRAALADLLLAQDRFAEALALCDLHRAAPAMAVRRLLALAGQGVDISAQADRMDARFRSWLAAGDYRHAREMARFYLDISPDPSLAYTLARENLRHQREPEDLALLARASDAS